MLVAVVDLLYPDGPPLAACETTAPLPLDSDCTRCKLHTGANTVCMRAEGAHLREAGPALVVVGMYPGAEEDRLGRPNVGTSGRYLRGLVKRWWSGPVVYDNALKCRLGSNNVTGKIVEACRPYLTQVLDGVQAPRRVLLLGRAAQMGVLGRSAPPMSTRRGYAWLPYYEACAYLLPHPARLRA
jgi:uracil-DNA glycosylase family 4